MGENKRKRYIVCQVCFGLFWCLCMNIHCNETQDTNSNEVIFCLVNSFINVFEDIQPNKLKWMLYEKM